MIRSSSLRDAMLMQLKELYSAEHQLLRSLPIMKEHATNRKLIDVLHCHLLDTEGHVERLDDIGAMMQMPFFGRTCKAMRAIIDEGEDLISQNYGNEGVVDIALIGTAQRIQHYEMAAYGCSRAIAHELGEERIASILSQTLDENREVDRKLTTVAEREVLVQANAPIVFIDGQSPQDGTRKERYSSL